MRNYSECKRNLSIYRKIIVGNELQHDEYDIYVNEIFLRASL